MIKTEMHIPWNIDIGIRPLPYLPEAMAYQYFLNPAEPIKFQVELTSPTIRQGRASRQKINPLKGISGIICWGPIAPLNKVSG